MISKKFMKNSLKILLAIISIVLITGCLEQKEKIQNVIPDVLTTPTSHCFRHMNPVRFRIVLARNHRLIFKLLLQQPIFRGNS